MRTLTFFFAFFIFGFCYGQEIQYQYFSWKWKTVPAKKAKIIRVIKIVNDSLYEVTDVNKFGTLYMKGEYSSLSPMVENGYFEFYEEISGRKIATGNYTKGVMTGEWTYYFRKPERTRTISYDITLLSSPETARKLKSQHITQLDQDVKFQGSVNIDDFNAFIGEQMVFPPMPQRYLVEGWVYVEFDIDEKGKICNIRVEGSRDKDLAREAIRVIASSPQWTPAYANGKAVPVHIIVPFHFDLK